MTSPSSPPTDRFATLVSVILILIVVAVLFFAKEIFVPLALALLFSFLLAPLVTRFETLAAAARPGGAAGGGARVRGARGRRLPRRHTGASI